MGCSPYLELLTANPSAALEVLGEVAGATLSDNQFAYLTRDQGYGWAYELMGKKERARSHFESARVFLEKKLKENREDVRLHSSLGIVYAALGRKEEAIRAGTLATELLPMSKEAWRGALRLVDLAKINAHVGEPEAAIDILESLLVRPINISAPLLAIDPVWKPLRDHPRFQSLLAPE